MLEKLKRVNKKEIVKTILISGTMILLSSHNVFAGNEITSKIDGWGNDFLDIAKTLFKWGGPFSLLAIGIFLYFNTDEAGAKKGKLAFGICMAATFVGWFADPIMNTFRK